MRWAESGKACTECVIFARLSQARSLPRDDDVLEPAYISALAALTGSAIGGLTSLAASWLTHRVQFTADQSAKERGRREELYRSFIEEAARLYADAYAHNIADVSSFVN